MSKNKYFYLSFTIYLLLNPLFMAAATIETSDIQVFSDVEKFALGVYFVIWIIFGIVIYAIPAIKAGLAPKPKEKTMDEVIDDIWKQHKSENNGK